MERGTPDAASWKLDHRPALDGLRGVAVLLVVVSHSLIGTPFVLTGGVAGVTLFFVLSGYLITGLLIPEAEAGSADVRAFYARRARRLLPALLVVLAAVPVLLWIARDPFLGAYPADAATALLYVRNYFQFQRGAGFDGVLGHTWSLSVEEQFYLLWPAMLLGTYTISRRVRMSPVWAVGGLAVLAGLWRIALAYTPHGPLAHLRLDANAVGLLAGATVAVAESRGLVLRSRAAAIAALVAVVALANGSSISFGAHIWTGAATAVAGAILVSRGSDRVGVLSLPVLRWFGRVSYGWYLWHVPLISVWINGHEPPLIQRWVASSVALGLAALSYRFIEQPFLRRRSERRAEVLRGDVQRRVAGVDRG